MTEDQLEILRDKYVVWEAASRSGNTDLRDYNRRCAEALKAALCIVAASPESGPLGLKMQSNPSSLSDITRYREALESVKAWDALQDAFPHDLAMKVSEALSSVVGEGGEGLSSSVAESGGTASPKSASHSHSEASGVCPKCGGAGGCEEITCSVCGGSGERYDATSSTERLGPWD